MVRTTIDYGIQLGVEHSAIARCRGTEVEVLRNGLGQECTPSVVWLDKEGRVVVGQRAKAQLEMDAENARGEFKLQMGTDTEYVFTRSGRRLRPEDLSAEVLKSLVADARRKTGEEVEAAVICVPAAFEVAQCLATQRAAKAAGLRASPLLQEPVAAALAYGFPSTETKASWLVYELGGSAFDAAVVRQTDGELSVVHHGGDHHLGGRRVDWDLVEQVLVPAVLRAHPLPDFRRGVRRWAGAFAKLEQQAATARIVLATDESFDVVVGSLGTDDRGADVRLACTVTRGDVERVLEPYVARSLHVCRRVLERTGDVQRVLFVGDPTLAPYLRDRLADPRTGLGVPLDLGVDPMTVVARGAAVFAGSQTMPAAGVGHVGRAPAAAAAHAGGAPAVAPAEPPGRRAAPPAVPLPLRPDLVADATSPEVYRRNPFRVAGALAFEGDRELRRRTERLELARRLGRADTTASGPLPVLPAPEASATRAATERLSDPERRLLDETFWLWPSPAVAPEHDGVAALARGDLAGALRAWAAQGTVGRHDAAIALHALALDHEASREDERVPAPDAVDAEVAWDLAVPAWDAVVRDRDAWDTMALRALETADPRTASLGAESFRDAAVAVVAGISARLALRAAESGDLARARRHAARLRSLEPGAALRTAFDDALRRELTPHRRALEGLVAAADARQKADPREGLAASEELVARAAPHLALFAALLPPGDPVRAGAFEAVAVEATGDAVVGGKATGDWASCDAALRRHLAIAQETPAEPRLRQTLENVKARLSEQVCWFCGVGAKSPAHAVTRRLFGEVRIVTGGSANPFDFRLGYKTAEIPVPRCATCAEAHRRGTSKPLSEADLVAGAQRRHRAGAVGWLVTAALALFLVLVRPGLVALPFPAGAAAYALAVALCAVALDGRRARREHAEVGAIRSRAEREDAGAPRRSHVRGVDHADVFPAVRELRAAGWKAGAEPTLADLPDDQRKVLDALLQLQALTGRFRR